MKKLAFLLALVLTVAVAQPVRSPVGSPTGNLVGASVGLTEQAALFAPLTNSTILPKGTGTFGAVSVGDADGNRYVLDNEHVYRATKAEEVRFRGGRRIENLVVASEDLTDSWTNSNTTDSGTTVTATAGNGTLLQTYTGGGTDHAFIFSVTLTRVTGTGNIDLTVDGGSTWTTVTLTSSAQRFSVTDSSETNPQFGIRIVTSGDAVTMEKAQLEESTGRIDTTTPSEYVSSGVLSSPFHGANVDGVKYFTTTNGNSVASNVVTEGTGTPLDQELISNSGYSGTIGNGSKFVNTDGWTASGSTLSVVSGELVVTNSGAANGEARDSFTTVANQIYTLFYDFNYDSIAGQVEVGTSAGDNSLYDSGDLTADTVKRVTFKASGTTTHISLITSTATATNATDWKAVSVVASRPTYFAEGAATNLINQPRDLTHADWVDLGAITTQVLDETGIDGQPTVATTVGDDNAAATEGLREAVTISNDSLTNTAWWSVKKDSDTARFPLLYLWYAGGTQVDQSVGLNTSTGATAEIAGLDDGSFGSIDMGDWWLVYASLPNNTTGNTTANIDVYPAYGGTIATNDNAATGEIIIDNVALVANTSYPTSPLLNTGGHARLADTGASLDLTNVSNTGSIEFDWTPSHQGFGLNDGLITSGGAVGVGVRLFSAGVDRILFNDDTNLLIDIANAWTVADQTIHIKLRFNATTLKANMSVDGTPDTEDTYDGTLSWTTDISLLEGTTYGAGIKNLKIYNTDKSETWLAQ